MANLSRCRSGVIFLLSLAALLVLLPADLALAQADWSAKVIKQRNPAEKERIAATSAHRLGVSEQALLNLVDNERHGPAVASAVGQYFEKATQVPQRFIAIQEAVRRRDIGAKTVVFAAMSPIAEQLIAALTLSRDEIDRQIAARMIAVLETMKRLEQDARRPVPEGKPNAQVIKQAEPPPWLKGEYSAQLKTLIETSKSRDTLEYAFLAVGLGRMEALRELAQAHVSHRVPDVAYAARFAMASLGDEVDAGRLIEDLANIERTRAKDPLSYDPGHSPLVYLMMTAGEGRVVEAVDPLMGYLADRDVHAGVAAARALGRIGGEGVAVRLLEAITEEVAWPVRVAIYDAVGAKPDKAAVPLLLERFEAETGRLRQDVLHALLSIAAGGPEEQTIEGFNLWWAQNADGFEVDGAGTMAWRDANRVGDLTVEPFTGFYGTAVISDRMVFAIDASKSIDENQLALLKQTLVELVAAFSAEMQFNFVDFGGHVRVLGKGRMVSGEVRERALNQFLHKTELTFGTRIFEAIETSMDLPGADTVHFLSDGQAYASQVNSWQRIDYATRLRTMTVPVAVHVIFFPKKGDPVKIARWKISKEMRDFANAHAGRFEILVPEAK